MRKTICVLGVDIGKNLCSLVASMIPEKWCCGGAPS